MDDAGVSSFDLEQVVTALGYPPPAQLLDRSLVYLCLPCPSVIQFLLISIVIVYGFLLIRPSMDLFAPHSRASSLQSRSLLPPCTHSSPARLSRRLSPAHCGAVMQAFERRVVTPILDARLKFPATVPPTAVAHIAPLDGELSSFIRWVTPKVPREHLAPFLQQCGDRLVAMEEPLAAKTVFYAAAADLCQRQRKEGTPGECFVDQHEERFLSERCQETAKQADDSPIISSGSIHQERA